MTPAIRVSIVVHAAGVIVLALAPGMWPWVAAAVVTCGLLVLGGHELSIFHLVGLLLVVAVGSNYSLFFDRGAPGQDRGRTLVSLLFAAVTTVIGFGLLAFSAVPVLNAIGSTVGLGAAMALVFSAIMSRPSGAEEAYARAS